MPVRREVPGPCHPFWQAHLPHGIIALIIATGNLSLGTCHVVADSAATPERRPNIVLILADDKYDSAILCT